MVSAALLMLFELVIMYKFWLSTRDFTRVMEELSPRPDRVGTIAPHLHRGRHRRAAQEALLADERYCAPEAEDDPGFWPYPQPNVTPTGTTFRSSTTDSPTFPGSTPAPGPSRSTGQPCPGERRGAPGAWENSR